MIKKIYSILKYIVNHPLNAKTKSKAVFNFIRWQFGIRLISARAVIPWIGESRLIIGAGETGVTGNIYVGLAEYEDMLFVMHALNPSEIFLDIGANVGVYSIIASKVVGANSIAFEPIPETIERLKDQVAINGIHNKVVIKNNGVGREKEILFFSNNNDTVNRVINDIGCNNVVSVQVIAIDEEIDHKMKYFFKIDVEGFEYNVVEGAKKILSSENTQAVIIELNGSGEAYGFMNNEIHQKLLEFNLKPVSYNPFLRTLVELNDYNRKGGNTIYVKNIALISARCKTAPKQIIHTASGISI
jgi:FkbM family methyltransferase